MLHSGKRNNDYTMVDQTTLYCSNTQNVEQLYWRGDKKTTNSFITRVTLDGMEIVLCTDIDLPGTTNGQN